MGAVRRWGIGLGALALVSCGVVLSWSVPDEVAWTVLVALSADERPVEVGPLRTKSAVTIEKLGLTGSSTSWLAWPDRWRTDEAIGEAPNIFILDEHGVIRWHSAGATPDPEGKIAVDMVYTINKAVLFALDDL